MPQSRRSSRRAGQGAPEPSASPLRALRGRGYRRQEPTGTQQRSAAPDPAVVPEPCLLVPEPRLPFPEPCLPVFEPRLSVSEPHLPVPKPRLPVLEPHLSVPEFRLPVSKPRVPVPRILPRPNQRDFVPELVENMPEVPDFDASTAADKAIRRGYREHLNRRTNAGRRVEAREARMNKEWEANVRKYGEEEARRC
ncbi:hypothetical protein MMC29_004450 [Sticta canariensis]|nr:hypothetical protein [Sticta canariensis]